MDKNEKKRRVFFSPELAGSGGEERLVSLSSEEAHHALRVLRLRRDDDVRLFDGAGWFYDGMVCEMSKRDVRVRIENAFPSEAEPEARLIMLVAQLKGKKADLLVQKFVELGVSELWFFESARSIARHREATGSAERWEKVVVSACKQCGRAGLMTVRSFLSLQESLAALPEDIQRYAFWEEEKTATLSDASDSGVGACALIGPEGGLEAEEVRLAVDAEFQVCSLGRRILRAETAALAAASILLSRFGELG